MYPNNIATFEIIYSFRRAVGPLCTTARLQVRCRHLLQLLAPPQDADHRSGGAGGEQEGRARQGSSLKHLRVQLVWDNYFKGELQNRIEVQP